MCTHFFVGFLASSWLIRAVIASRSSGVSDRPLFTDSHLLNRVSFSCRSTANQTLQLSAWFREEVGTGYLRLHH